MFSDLSQIKAFSQSSLTSYYENLVIFQEIVAKGLLRAGYHSKIMDVGHDDP